MSVIRVKRKHHFTTIPNAAVRDVRLSLQAKGLLAEMLSYPDDWAYNLSHLEANSANGRDAHRKALNELIAAGYAKWTYQHDGKKLVGRELTISDEAIWGSGTESQAGSTVGLKNSPTGSPTVGKPATTKTEVHEEPTTNEEPPQAPPSLADSTAGEWLSPTGDTRETPTSDGEHPAPVQRSRAPAKDSRAGPQAVLDAYNQHRGGLPEAKRLNPYREGKIRSLIRAHGLDEAIAVMAIGANEVSHDPWYQKHKYGLDTLLREHKVVQKAETALSRGTTDRSQAETDRLLAAIGGA